MGAFKKIVAVMAQTALIPVELIKDATTLGGVLTGKSETYTGTRLREIDDTLEEMLSDLRRVNEKII